jgi:hypothetical protein
MTDGLEVLDAPAPRSITLKGREFLVKPFVMGQIKRAKAIAQKLHAPADIQLYLPEQMDEDAVAKAISSQIQTLLPEMIYENADELMEFAALVTGEPVEYFADIELSDFVVACIAIFDANRDFFLREILPQMMLHLMEQLRQRSNSTGATPSRH